MGKLNFKNGQVEDYTIVLSNRELQKQGQISNVKGVKHNGNLASAQVINFTVYKHQLFPDREEENFPYESIEAYQDYIWENLVDFKVVYVKELNENFEIRVSIDDANDTIKTITGTSLCEVELGQTNLYNFEINSELDISRDDYEVTTFYNDENPNASLLHRVLSKVPHYKIKHVDKSLIKLQRTFSVDGVPIYDFLMGECSEQFSCLFRFDSTDRSISVYDLMTVCKDCGERGEYTSVCPKCGSKNLQYFGQDTTIYVDKNNLTDSIHLEVDGDSIKNCFKFECGDEVMTAAVRALNPNGSDYIYRINENDRKDMSTELVNKIDSYDKLYESYTEEYHSITEQSYDLVDDILYYQSSMMPTIEESEVTAQTEADKLSKAYYDGNFNLVALTTVTTATNKTTVNSALKNYARIFVKTGYVKLDIEDDATFEYVGVDDNNWNYGTWYGRIKVTNYSDKEDIAYTDYMTITVNDNYHEFVAQKIQKNIKTDDKDGSVFDVLSIEDLDKFKEALTLYSLNRLKSFADAIQGALDILIELDQAGESADLYGILYLPYYEKLKACQSELDIRQAKIDELQHDLDLFEERRIEIQADLNFESYLGDLYPIFCAYRREDKFNNPNYISDGLDNSQLLQRAKEFWELAEKEIFKSSNGVITITSTLYNLLVMKEFEPLVKYFELGNWIRIRVDGQLYRLRLIGYEINFDSLQTINVTFSTVTKIKDLNVETEIESVIQSTKSMATSYSSVQKQAEKGREANDNVNSILQNGLNAGQAQITNNDNEEVTYGKHGILCRSYDDILGDFVDKQLKLTHNTIAFTDDNWKSVKTVIGENNYISYNSAENKWEQLVGYGLISQYVMSGIIYGENEIIGGMIRSKNYSDGKTLDKDGNILQKGGSYIDLNTGEFSFGGDSILYKDRDFHMNGGTIYGSKIITDNPNTDFKIIINDGTIYTYGSKDGLSYQTGRITCFRNTSEIENVYDGLSIITTGDAFALGIGNDSKSTFDSYYYLNNGYNSNGYTERHIWYGTERHASDAIFNRNILRYGFRDDGSYALTGYISAFKRDSETSNNYDGFGIVTSGDCLTLSIGDITTFDSYYYLNNGHNPNGYTERHIWYGTERHLGDAYFDSNITSRGTMYSYVGSDYLGYSTDGTVKCNNVLTNGLRTETIRVKNQALADSGSPGYCNVATCGTGHSVHFNWVNDSKLAVWVDSTQIGYIALQ